MTPTIRADAKPINAKQVAITFAGIAEHSFAQKANPFFTSNILIETWGLWSTNGKKKSMEHCSSLFFFRVLLFIPWLTISQRNSSSEKLILKVTYEHRFNEWYTWQIIKLSTDSPEFISKPETARMLILFHWYQSLSHLLLTCSMVCTGFTPGTPSTDHNTDRDVLSDHTRSKRDWIEIIQWITGAIKKTRDLRAGSWD